MSAIATVSTSALVKLGATAGAIQAKGAKDPTKEECWAPPGRGYPGW
jgi:hypothetical protein